MNLRAVHCEALGEVLREHAARATRRDAAALLADQLTDGGDLVERMAATSSSGWRQLRRADGGAVAEEGLEEEETGSSVIMIPIVISIVIFIILAIVASIILRKNTFTKEKSPLKMMKSRKRSKKLNSKAEIRTCSS